LTSKKTSGILVSEIQKRRTEQMKLFTDLHLHTMNLNLDGSWADYQGPRSLCLFSSPSIRKPITVQEQLPA